MKVTVATRATTAITAPKMAERTRSRVRLGARFQREAQPGGRGDTHARLGRGSADTRGPAGTPAHTLQAAVRCA